ncbi:uncharacterized protein OCT59_014456 [Rhizophagus irregularis]|uniref:uncharacterized protein n=1 Tax=Rhizophagus irregularis TaxID=588596 RepID=UPI003325F3EA|nr:hypothetical protein OCT59_014456 [Rhizophagus irregularis]
MKPSASTRKTKLSGPRTSQEESLSPGEASGLEKNLYTLGDGKRGVLRDQVSGSSSSKWEPEETDSESESG